MRLKLSNPLAFTPLPVTFLVTLVYLAILIPVLVIHVTVPPAPKDEIDGVNIEQAWQDLQMLTKNFHPYNSRENDKTRSWLLDRIDWILSENGASFAFETVGQDLEEEGGESAAVTVFDDSLSNLTFSAEGRLEKGGSHSPGQSVYFEGTNIIVYIRGSDDDKTLWWRTKNADDEFRPSKASQGGVMVNAHYDSVSTAYGATDDGVGIVTMLQLLSHFTKGGNTPKNGIVLLFNNGEEDYLNGARAFVKHPISTLAHTFLNLEGVGAGGRATLFRSTDTEVTRYYKQSKYPFGTVISSDGFKAGLVRSQTDYVVFNGALGLRGLDVAFLEPRQRYHTNEDDAKHTSKASIWHMLSMSLTTVKGLSGHTGKTFEGPSKKHDEKVPAGIGSNAVWFDVFGRGFAVFELKTLFALSLTLLIVSPLVLMLIAYLLRKKNKMYLFKRKTPDGQNKLHAWRGFFRTPFVLAISGAATVGIALLINKINPEIIYSCHWLVWTVSISSFLNVSWLLLSSIDFARPSALYRAYSFLWLYFLGWVVLVGATLLEDRYDIAGVYFFLFYLAAVSLAASISMLELFALPAIHNLGDDRSAENREEDRGPSSRRSTSQNSRTLLGSSETDQQPDRNDDQDGEGGGDNEEATESTPLFRGGLRSSFSHYRSAGSGSATPSKRPTSSSFPSASKVYSSEQAWSGSLPSWTWILQLLLVAPIVIILLGQAGLLIISAIHQTAADGNSALISYLAIALFTILIFIPTLPFLHRFTHHIPIVLFFVLIGTLIYALLAFPFSAQNRLKVYFVQSLDLDSSSSNPQGTVTLTGLSDYMPIVLSALTSSHNKHNCTVPSNSNTLSQCTYPARPPPLPKGYKNYTSLVHFTATLLPANVSSTPAALFRVYAPPGSRACRIVFDGQPITSISVTGSSPPDSRFPQIPSSSTSEDAEGAREIRLWSRTWDREWEVRVGWEDEDEHGSKKKEKGAKRRGKVVCLWSDANEKGQIPALDEIWQFAPPWVAVSKAGDGLVEGWKRWEL